jgi:hypothetical protein
MRSNSFISDRLGASYSASVARPPSGCLRGLNMWSILNGYSITKVNGKRRLRIRRSVAKLHNGLML